MNTIVDACRLLGDETRLRLLRVLTQVELNVTELTAVLGISQSGVSRHLRLLREAGLVAERREGSWTYFSLRGDGEQPATSFWTAARPLLADDEDQGGDLARLEEVLRQRRERASSPFDSVDDRLPVPGRSWIAWARGLLHLVPPARVADIGCGDGGLALELARFASEVVAIDRSPAMLERARARAAAAGMDNIRCRLGELELLPLENQSVELCVLSQILHHAAQPQRALAEAGRVLCDGGRVLIIDLAPHTEEWVRERLGDQWLGFAPEQLREMLVAAGFSQIRLDTVPGRRGEAFEVLIASGQRPAASANRRATPSDR